MSNMARSDEIDELVSSVRNLVSYKDAAVTQKPEPQDRLLLTPALRVDTADAETQTPEIMPEPAPHQEPPTALVLQDGVAPEKSTLGGTAQELEAAVTARAEDWEADGGESFDQAAWAASAFDPPQDDSETPATSRSADVPQADAHHEGADESDLETRIANDIVTEHVATQFDETALRAAVVQILREELAGEMGERITRNVRKLVRREINRVLVSRDLD